MKNSTINFNYGDFAIIKTCSALSGMKRGFV